MFGSKLATAWRERASWTTLLRSASVSFSQYGEDQLFDRLLRPGRRGLYVDVGANHPIEGSNSYRLYLRGWSGLAIDPNPAFADDYRRRRPRDTYLAEGVSATDSELIYHEFTAGVFNTFDPGRVAHLVAEGRTLVGRRTVRCRPLSEILPELIGDRQIDLLNIDCEGMDLEVIRSNDMAVSRPTVLIVEDYDRYLAFQRGEQPAPFDQAIRELGYLPIAQSAWSSIFVATDWRRLFARSEAYSEARVRNGYMP